MNSGSYSIIHDIAVIGGGINGCGIARDAAGRGLSVFLCEQSDLASATSSWSTKLIHGGLRYLEYYEFRLVHEALAEREVLWRMAPHIIEPLRFVLPHHKGLRPAWLLRLGLFLYDNLGGRKLLPGTRTLDLAEDGAGAPLKGGAFRRGFEYSDCRVDDSRLVVLNARDAADRGARIATRCTAVAARRDGAHWVLSLRHASGRVEEVHARALVNAGGPWVAKVLETCLPGKPHRAQVRLVQGSHIVVKRLFNHDRCYIFQNRDGRILFAIPYEGNFTLIGTTDRDYKGDPAGVRSTEDEITYLLDSANEYFRTPVQRDDVVWTYSGVRPLYDDGASEAKAATRDYVLELDSPSGLPPLLSVFGGKITTYRRLAETAMDLLAPAFPGLKPAWTRDAPLPGGDFPVDGRSALTDALLKKRPFLEPAQAARLVRLYGTRAVSIFADGAGSTFGGGLTEAELRYLMRMEWARTSEDVLWRRTKLGLVLSEAERASLAAFMDANAQ